MPKFRENVIENWKSLGDSGTETVDIKGNDILSRLIVGFRATNGSTDNKNNNPARVITKIELVDGSDVLYSLSGQEAFANYFYDSRQMPIYSYSGRASAIQYAFFPINFGRILYDPDLALDLTKHNNVQLKITWNLAAITAVGVTGFATGTSGLKVIANIMEDVVQPSGFLMTKDIYSFSTGASGDQRIDLPVDYPIRRIMIRAYEIAVLFGDSLTNYKLSLDNDKYIPFNLSTDDLFAHYMGYWPPAVMNFKLLADDTNVIQTFMAYLSNALITSGTTSVIAGLTTDTAGQVTVASEDDASAASNDNPANLRVEGYGLENTLAYQFGRWNVPNEWLQTQEYDSARLYLTQGNAGAAANVFIQQLRPY
jgi:hypothetical protein